MKFAIIYHRVLSLWPRSIDISDGYKVEGGGATPSNCPIGKVPYFFPNLSKAWDKVEEQIDVENDTWGDMMVWTMFQEFHEESKKLLVERVTHLKPDKVSIDSIEKRYRENLQVDEWEYERSEYEKSNKMG